MDACVEQDDGYRFVYCLPFSADRTAGRGHLLLDLADPRRPARALPGRKPFAAPGPRARRNRGSRRRACCRSLLGGGCEDLWSAAEPPVARLGLRGGFFHPTTGYSLPDAVRNAVLLAEQADLTSAALHDVFRRRSAELWQQRRFYRLLNRMLFRAAEPKRRYRVLEHFYRLPEPVIAPLLCRPARPRSTSSGS